MDSRLETSRRLVVLAFVALVVVALAGPAAAGTQLTRAKAFAKRHGLATRTIKVGPRGRTQNRFFVAVTPETFAEFTQEMTTGSDGLLARFTNDGLGHIALATQPGQVLLWARDYGADNNGRGDYTYLYFNPQHDGYLLAINPTDIDHLKGWLAARNRADDRLFCGGNCMEWIGNAETGKDGLMLFHDLGIKRSKSGHNMRAKLIHAANERLEVVGVTVPDVAAFDAKTDDQLLGNPPAGGVDDALHEKK